MEHLRLGIGFMQLGTVEFGQKQALASYLELMNDLLPEKPGLKPNPGAG